MFTHCIHRSPFPEPTFPHAPGNCWPLRNLRLSLSLSMPHLAAALNTNLHVAQPHIAVQHKFNFPLSTLFPLIEHSLSRRSSKPKQTSEWQRQESENRAAAERSTLERCPRPETRTSQTECDGSCAGCQSRRRRVDTRGLVDKGTRSAPMQRMPHDAETFHT